MQDELPLTRQQNIVWGVALVAVALLLAFLIYTQPQKLHAPAWVAYTAAGTFLVGGFSLIASAKRAFGVQNWLAVVLLVALVVPGAWVAFGPGERQGRERKWGHVLNRAMLPHGMFAHGGWLARSGSDVTGDAPRRYGVRPSGGPSTG